MGFSIASVIPIIQDQGKNLVGVEVGCDKGKSTRFLVESCGNVKKVYTIDPWRAYDDGILKVGQEEQDNRFKEAKKHLEYYTDQCKIEIVKADSLLAVKQFENNSLDFVFIDGNHSFEGAYADIKAWYMKVKQGGVVSGHDFRYKDLEVRRAVKQFCDENNYGFPEPLVRSWCWYFYKGQYKKKVIN